MVEAHSAANPSSPHPSQTSGEHFMHKLVVTTMSVLALSGAATAQDNGARPSGESATVSELRSIVTALQQQVDELKAANDDNWLTEQRADEIRGLVQDVIADADTRASLLQSGVMAGWDKGFFISSADGNWRLNIGGQIQIRYVYNWQDNSPV